MPNWKRPFQTTHVIFISLDQYTTVSVRDGTQFQAFFFERAEEGSFIPQAAWHDHSVCQWESSVLRRSYLTPSTLARQLVLVSMVKLEDSLRHLPLGHMCAYDRAGSNRMTGCVCWAWVCSMRLSRTSAGNNKPDNKPDLIQPAGGGPRSERCTECGALFFAVRIVVYLLYWKNNLIDWLYGNARVFRRSSLLYALFAYKSSSFPASSKSRETEFLLRYSLTEYAVAINYVE